MVGVNRQFALLIGISVVGFGCGEDGQTSDDDVMTVRSALTVAFNLPLFLGSNPSDISLGAAHSLAVNDGAVIREFWTGGPQDFGLVSNLGTGVAGTTVGTNVGVSAQVGTILSRPVVMLRSNANVGGSVYQGVNAAPVEQTGVKVSGVTKVNVGYATDTTWSRSVAWPSTINPAPNLEPGQMPQTVPLAPGAYHTLDVKTGRTLSFSAGEYFLDGLIVESGAAFNVDGRGGPVFIYILDGGFILRGLQLVNATTPGLGFASLTIFTTGSATIQSPFSGVLVAGGRIDLSGGSFGLGGHIGSFFGNDVTAFERNLVQHRRDPYSFRGFVPPNGIGDRASVTGGSLRLPGLDSTDEAHQSESVTAISRNGGNFVVTVGYNDGTQNPLSPTFKYTDTSVGDPRDGTGRLIMKGHTAMGWSFSTDGGHTFTYGGRVRPPTGWSVIWGDPAIAKANIDDPNVYYSQISGTTAAFESVWDPNLQAIVSSGQNIAGALTGYCIARSTDRGVNFNAVACEASGFQDGDSLAVAVDQAGHRQVYVSGTGARILRMDGETMAFSPPNTIPNPFVLPAGQSQTDHPRMLVFNGLLYFAQKVATSAGAVIMMNRLNAATNATTWLGQATVMCGANPCLVLGGSVALGGNTFLPAGPGFAFDIGPDGNGQNKLRVIFTAQDGVFNGPNLRSVNVAECALDVTNCRSTGWSTVGDVGEEVNPSLRSSGGHWVATWRKFDAANPINLMRHVAGNLDLVGGVEKLQQRTLFPDTVPCFYNKTEPGFVRLGEYDLIDGFGDGRFFAPYSTTGPGCRWQGTWTSDSHVGGSAFAF